MDSAKENTEKLQLDGKVVVACVMLQTREAEHLLALFREAVAALAGSASAGPPHLPTASPQADSEDPWLKHADAAKYLGISTSTLYRYACQQNIECRKLGGRLEYHRSALDRFKEKQTRPARRAPESRSIIVSAHSSGK
jgi:excisionase family DNA binding protein